MLVESVWDNIRIGLEVVLSANLEKTKGKTVGEPVMLYADTHRDVCSCHRAMLAATANEL